MVLITRGDALRFARACPWLSYSAPLALLPNFEQSRVSPQLLLRLDLSRYARAPLLV